MEKISDIIKEDMFGYCYREGKAVVCVSIRKQQLGLEMQLSARPLLLSSTLQRKQTQQ